MKKYICSFLVIWEIVMLPRYKDKIIYIVIFLKIYSNKKIKNK